MANKLLSRFKITLPGKKSNEKGTAVTPTFNPSNSAQILTLPQYREHLTDIFSNRNNLDSRALIQDLFRTDPDMSATVNSFLTVADTDLLYLVKDSSGQVDRAGQELMAQLLTALTTRIDYSKGFKVVQSISSICEAFRYMILLRGGIGSELVINKEFMPIELRQVDMGFIEWFEKLPGQYTPQQKTPDGKTISLDFPNFFVAWFRRDPTNIYSWSPFVSAINTIAARQQVINDLYRIMNLTGYPRMEVEVVEEVIWKNAPVDVLADPKKKAQYIANVFAEITRQVNNIRPDQSFVHSDAVKPKIMNEKGALTMNIDSIINTLNSQNQAGLKTMATIIGRGEAGVNTGTVEARVFSMNAQAINKPIADLLSQAFTLALRLQGSESNVQCFFKPVELRPETELEPNKTMRATRLKADLSLGLITDEEYHLEMYGRLPPPGAPMLSGTNFLDKQQAQADGASTKTTDKNSNPNDRSAQTKEKAAPARDNNAGANRVK